jgi:hypothetical protein
MSCAAAAEPRNSLSCRLIACLIGDGQLADGRVTGSQYPDRGTISSEQLAIACFVRPGGIVGKVLDEITPELADWLARQRIFFVATAPLAPDGLLNCSPKGMNTFRMLGPKEVAYLDLTGSGIETIAHLQENGRIVFTFCAFSGPPKIVRLHGSGDAILPDTSEYQRLRPLFPDYPGERAIIRARLTRIGDSCGYSVPRYEYVDERDMLVKWAESKGVDGLAQYRGQKNACSLDGLPGLNPHG